MKVFIYTFGKVASSTLHNSISKYLDSDLPEPPKIKIYPPFSSVEPNVVHTHDHYVVRQYLKTGAKCKIISVYRELIAQTISAFFQNICNTNNWRCNYLFYVGSEDYDKSLPMEKIIEIFLYRVIEYHPQHWFNILNRVLDINIFHRSFNKNEGYQIYNGKTFELLIIRYDKLKEVSDVIRQFLGLSSFDLYSSNLSTDKWYADLYSGFKDVFRPPDWMITRYLKSRASHYFTEEQEIQQIINYYSKKVSQTNAQDYYKLGQKLEKEKQLDEALKAYKKATEIDQNNFWYHHNLANIFRKQNQCQQAITAYESAIKINPKFSWSYYHLGSLLQQDGKIQEAIIAYQKAVELYPNFKIYQSKLESLSQLAKSSIKYTSQKDQDKWVIEDIFQGKRNGFFVDLAASDGIALSNTYILEKHFQWTGICIEPNPEFYKKLQKNRNCICVNDCIDFQEGIVEFRFDNMELGGIIAEDTDNCIQYRDKQIIEARKNNKTTFIKAKTLEQVLRENNAPKIIDYLSLDVEGAETRILRSFPFDKYIFLSITIERPTPWINSTLFDNGYVFVQNSKVMGYDSFYVHKSIPNFELIKKEDFVQIPAKDW